MVHWSILFQRNRLPSYPAPPESVMDEWSYDPYDVQGQKKVWDFATLSET